MWLLFEFYLSTDIDNITKTIYNQSDKMKMPYNTLQTERRNLYGV